MVGLLSLLWFVFLPGCGPDATSLEVSNGLARTIHKRLDAQAAAADLQETPWWPNWQGALFQVGFEGIDDDLEMSDELRSAIEAYWDGNEIIEVPAELTLAEQGELLAGHHTRTEERFQALFAALEPMADRDNDETAARGLLVVATMQHLNANYSLYYQYPRLDMLNRVLLDGELPLGAPVCPLFDPEAQRPGQLKECELTREMRLDAHRAVFKKALTWVQEIEDQDPHSPWRETGKAVVLSGPSISVKPLTAPALPESTSLVEAVPALEVVITTDSISVNGESVINRAGGLPPDRAALGDSWHELTDVLRKKARNNRSVAARNPNVSPTQWLLQCDASNPMSLVHDVMATAYDVGLNKPDFIAMPVTSNPLLRYSSVVALPVVFVGQPENKTKGRQETQTQTTPPVLTVLPDGFVLQAPGEAPLQFRKEGAWPHKQLNHEVSKLKSSPDAGNQLFVIADPRTPYGTLVSTLDDVRTHDCDGENGCQEAFPVILIRSP